MRLLKVLVIISSAWFLMGCAANIKYSMQDKNLYKRDAPLNYHAVVDVFEDKRPMEECDGSLHKITGVEVVSTKNKNFKPNIDKQISMAFVEHLNKAKIFKVVELKDVDNNLDVNIQEMDKLKAEGVDLVILGKLNHFYGYQSYSVASAAAVMFGLAGVLTEAIANPKKVGGNVEYADVRIIDLDNHGILYQGNISHNFDEKDVFYDGQVIYSLRALKEANNKFAKKISEVVLEK